MIVTTLRYVMTALVASTLTAAALAQPCELEFGEPENLGPTVNSSALDGGPSITADGLTLFFSSGRPGGFGSADLWMSTRSGISDPWEPPINLGAAVNSSSNDLCTNISADGLTLLFQSPRAGGFGGSDLWETWRASIEDEWQAPVNLGLPVNTASHDLTPNLSVDGLTLYLSSDRAGGAGGIDLWMTTRISRTDPWLDPVNLGHSVNSSFDEGGPNVFTNELILVFNTDRPGGPGRRDLWMSLRSSAFDPWGQAEVMAPPVNSSSSDSASDISADGRDFFFKSDRPGGYGDDDLWQVTVIQHCGCVRDPAWVCDGDVDGEGSVNPVDVGLVMAAFGSIDEQDLCNYDVDCDEQINPVDAGIVLSLFGTCEEPRDVCP